MASPRVLVTHPGRQHAHQLTRALFDKGLLYEFWTGVPSAPPSKKGLLYKVLAHLSPQPTLDLPAEVISHCYIEPLVRRLAERASASPRALVWRHRAMDWFDRWCARRLPDDIEAVVCYENSALHTFREAKERGMTTILDAASLHHRWQDAVYEPVEHEMAHARITARKDREIGCADHVLTPSDLARRSYLEAGVPPEKVTAVPMGADLSCFSPPGSLPPMKKDHSFTFLLVGHADRRKGTDVLFEASRLLQAEGIDHRVHVAGEVDEQLFDKAPPTIKRLGYLPQGELNQALGRADVFVLPSRFDSFGRVVVEGLAAGLPALVSEKVGAKEVLTEGQNGWVVPVEDVEALAARMRWCVEHPDQVDDMQGAAVATAQDYTWDAYRERVVDCLKEVLDFSCEKEPSKEAVSASAFDPRGGL